jgi:hypothetical protein
MILKGATLDVSSNKLTITSCSSDDMPIQDQTTNYTFHLPYFEEANTSGLLDKAVAY